MENKSAHFHSTSLIGNTLYPQNLYILIANVNSLLEHITLGTLSETPSHNFLTANSKTFYLVSGFAEVVNIQNLCFHDVILVEWKPGEASDTLLAPTACIFF